MERRRKELKFTVPSLMNSILIKPSTQIPTLQRFQFTREKVRLKTFEPLTN